MSERGKTEPVCLYIAEQAICEKMRNNDSFEIWGFYLHRYIQENLWPGFVQGAFYKGASVDQVKDVYQTVFLEISTRILEGSLFINCNVKAKGNRPFLGYFYKAMVFKLIDRLEESRKCSKLVDTFDEVNHDNSAFSEEFKVLAYVYCEKLTKNQKAIFKEFFIDEISHEEITKRHNWASTDVSRNIKNQLKDDILGYITIVRTDDETMRMIREKYNDSVIEIFFSNEEFVS